MHYRHTFLSFFKAPVGVINDIEALFRCFLWGGSEGKKKIHWVAWANICKDREASRLGLRNIKAFNYALLGKWLWRLRVEVDCLWVKVLKKSMGWRGGL